MTWHERLKEKEGSNRKAAAHLFPKWKKIDREEVGREKTTVLALANKIGSLSSKGDETGWWKKRPVLQQLLADLLGVETNEIFGAPNRTLATTFREFPALSPLGRDEMPCRTSRAGSVFELACFAVNDHKRQRHWIVVPPGGGKSLAIELLRVRFPGEVIAKTVVRLGDAVAFTLNDGVCPVVVEVEESDAANDHVSVSALEMHRGSIVVLAPFKLPDGQRVESGTALLGSKPRTKSGNWVMNQGAPDAGWIERMLVWVDARLTSSLRDTKFEKDELLTWLDKFPAIRRAIQSPGDLLALCSDFDVYGSDGAPHERALRWLRDVGVKALPEDAPSSWATYVAADCVSDIVVGNALNRATALQERSFAEWHAFVPAGSPVSKTAPGPEFVVALLRAGGLLRAGARGVSLFPNWVGESMVQQHLVHLVRTREVQLWGAIAGDASRQYLVDDALDALSPSEFRTATEALLTHIAESDIGFAEVAGLEAVVAAFGRRLSRVEPSQRDAELARFALLQQLDHLVSGANIGKHRVPTTRRHHDEWFLSGWAISLATCGATVDVPDDLRWVLPGWATDLRISEALTLDNFPGSTISPFGASNAVRTLMALTPKVVARLTPFILVKNIPRLLLPALTLAGNWRLTHEHLAQLSGTWEETELAGMLQQLDDGRRTSLAEILWRFASDAVGNDKDINSAGMVTDCTGTTDVCITKSVPIAERITYFQCYHAPLLPFVLENLPVTVVEETARVAGTHRRLLGDNQYAGSDPRALHHLSLDQRSAAMRGRLSNEIRFDEVRELVEILDGDALEKLLDVVCDADLDVVAEFACRAWRILPDRAEAEARSTFGKGFAAAEAWFRTAPRARIGALIKVVRGAAVRPHWVQDWALEKLVDAGDSAEMLFRFMHPQPLSTLSSKKRKKKVCSP
jgi:hypothetical protein